MKRIAFFGPVNPIPSGISDYDEELLPLLRKDYEIDVFVDGEVRGSNIFHHGEFYFKQKNNPYDLCLYQIGNSLLHEYMYGYLFRYPGAVIFHDYCLHHSRAKMLFLKGLFDEYLAEARMSYPEEPRIGKTVYGGSAGELLLYYFPFIQLALKSSLVAGAHTEFVAKKLQVTSTPVIKIPMGIKIEDVTGEANQASELYPGKLVIGSFGFVTREKRLSSVLQALSELKWYYPNLIYLVVGKVAEHYDFQSEVASYGLQSIVEVTGHVDRKRFHQLMSRSDVIVNLRYPSAGEMSATLLRALAYGKPVLMSRLLQLKEIPDDCVIKIRPNRELEDLFHNLWQLIENKSLRDKLGAKALRYMHTNHQPKQMVNKYRELISAALERKQTFQKPELPLHLRPGSEIMREYIKNTSFSGDDSDLLDWIL